MGSFPHDRDPQYVPGTGPAAEPLGTEGDSSRDKLCPWVCLPPLGRTEQSDWCIAALGQLCVLR